MFRLWNSVGFKTVPATRSLRPLGDKVLNFFFGFLKTKRWRPSQHENGKTSDLINDAKTGTLGDNDHIVVFEIILTWQKIANPKPYQNFISINWKLSLNPWCLNKDSPEPNNYYSLQTDVADCLWADSQQDLSYRCFWDHIFILGNFTIQSLIDFN